MSTPLIEQEIYLLERYTSLEYFGMMRDAFRAMLNAGWAALDEFMLHLPHDYRSRHQSRQPDIVWGELVLANFGDTAEKLDRSYDLLEAGDYTALEDAHSVNNDLIGMMRDYPYNWMPEPFYSEFETQKGLASDLKGGIYHTICGSWTLGGLYYPTWKEEKESWHIYWKILPPPKTWPIYRLNPDVQVRTDEIVSRTGIYLPEIGESCPRFFIEGRKAMKARVGLDARGFHARSLEPTLWTLVERVADEGGPEPGREPWREDNFPKRVEGGQQCPREGWWWSPADNEEKVRFFKFGEITPVITSKTWGQSYWLWHGDTRKQDNK